MKRELNLLFRALKNIFLCKIYSINGNLRYPISILPKFYYYPTINIPSILEFQNVTLSRRSELSKEDTFNELGFLREDVLSTSDVPFLSLNLMGSYFKSEHNQFKPTLSKTIKWNGKSLTYLSELRKDYTLINQYCTIYLNAEGINNQEVPYKRPSSKPIDAEIKKFFTSVAIPKVENGNYNLIGITKIIHDPTNFNYWHVELNLIDYDGELFSKTNRSAYLKSFCEKVIKNIICINSNKSIDMIHNIPHHVFKKEKYMHDFFQFLQK